VERLHIGIRQQQRKRASPDFRWTDARSKTYALPPSMSDWHHLSTN